MIHYQGRWAVVTGASSGLGSGLAIRLADRGMSLVLTGRNETRLDQVAQDIRRAAPQVKVETVVADLSTVRCVGAARVCRRPPNRSADQRSASFFHHHCRRPGRTRRSHLHTPPHSQRYCRHKP